MDFSTALEQAIATDRRKAFRIAGAVTAGCLALSAVLFFAAHTAFVAVPMLIVSGAFWFLAVTGTPSAKALMRLRGAQPEQWLPSPSHGVLVVTPEHLVGGGLPRAELNRHARCRVTSISFDEEAHALTVDVTNVVQTRDGEREVLKRAVVALDRSVPGERAYAFARNVLGLSQR